MVLAIEDSKSKKDPMMVMERQYRHAAGQYLWEIPAGKIDDGEKRLPAAKRELLEETGYQREAMEQAGEVLPEPGLRG